MARVLDKIMLNGVEYLTAHNGVLNIKVNNESVATFGANASQGVEAKITVPVNVSDLTNDSGFITNTVNDLANYYTKTEIGSLIAGFAGFEVVSELPQEPETNIIYLKGPIGSGADKYEEWIYSNNAWVKIGETSVDLTNYFNTSTQTSDAITEGSTNLFLTSDERTKLGNTSGVNTGDQSASDFDIKDLADTDGLRATWSGKQDAISDLATIRSGAAAGATALQSGDNVSSLQNDAGYITSASLPDVYDASVSFTQAGANKGSLTVNQSANSSIALNGNLFVTADEYEQATGASTDGNTYFVYSIVS